MYRIGLVGSENSHARAFAKVFAQDADFSDLTVTAVYGNEGREKSEKILEYFPDAVIVESPGEMLPLVDGVMITSRDGKHHYPYAKAFLEAGIPLFVDKPFTCNPQEAIALDTDLKTWANASAWSLEDGTAVEITEVKYDFDPENIEPGIYDVTFGTKGYEYKVDTTDKYEVDDMVGLMFQPEDIHIMSKNNY